MRIAITGATGLLGGALVEYLATEGEYEITALLHGRGISNIPEIFSERIDWQHGDLRNKEDCARLVAGQDAVIHLAHISSPLTSDDDMAADARDNLLPTLQLIAAVRDTGRTPRFVFPSSGGTIYGMGQTRPYREDDPCLPANGYGILKRTVEHYLRLASERGHLTAAILRISNAYGKPLPENRPQGLIGTAISRVLAGKPIRIIGNPDNVRDYVHVDDIARAVSRALALDSPYSCFNIAAGQGHSVLEVIDRIEALWGQPVRREFSTHANAQFLPNRCVLDIAKARNELGWTPAVDLNSGLAQMLGPIRHGT